MFEVLFQGCLAEWVGLHVRCLMVGGHVIEGTLRVFGTSSATYFVESTHGSGSNRVPLFTLVRSAQVVALELPPGYTPAPAP